MTLEEQIKAGHDPAVIEPFEKIRQALEESRPDLLEDLKSVVERHEKMNRDLYGAKSTINSLNRSLYTKRCRK